MFHLHCALKLSQKTPFTTIYKLLWLLVTEREKNQHCVSYWRLMVCFSIVVADQFHFSIFPFLYYSIFHFSLLFSIFLHFSILQTHEIASLFIVMIFVQRFILMANNISRKHHSLDIKLLKQSVFLASSLTRTVGLDSPLLNYVRT